MDDNTTRGTGRRSAGNTSERVLGNNGYASVSVSSREDGGRRGQTSIKRITVPSEERFDDVMEQYGHDRNLVESYFTGFAEDLNDAVNAYATVSQKDSKYILSVYEHNITAQEDPLAFRINIVTEYLPSLEEYVQEKGITLGGAVRVAIDICEALSLCHGNGLVHGAVKERNIFVREGGSKEGMGFKLGDAGISRILWDPTVDAQNEAAPYTAPEMFKGEQGEESADIYALGIVLYKLFNDMRMPFEPIAPPSAQVNTANGENRRRSGEIPPLPRKAGERLGTIIRKACGSKDRRHKTPKALKDELQKYLETLTDGEKNTAVVFPVGASVPGRRAMGQARASASSFDTGEFEKPVVERFVERKPAERKSAERQPTERQSERQSARQPAEPPGDITERFTQQDFDDDDDVDIPEPQPVRRSPSIRGTGGGAERGLERGPERSSERGHERRPERNVERNTERNAERGTDKSVERNMERTAAKVKERSAALSPKGSQLARERGSGNVKDALDNDYRRTMKQGNLSRIIMIAIAVLLCGGLGVGGYFGYMHFFANPLSNFEKHLDARDYTAAAQVFTGKISGDEDLTNEAINLLQQRLHSSEQAFAAGEVNFDEALELIKGLEYIEALDENTLYASLGRVEEINDSLDNFNRAVNLYNDGAWSQSITLFSRVRDIYHGYETAQRLRGEAARHYKNEMLPTATPDGTVDSYSRALETLREMLITLPGDTEILEQIAMFQTIMDSLILAAAEPEDEEGQEGEDTDANAAPDPTPDPNAGNRVENMRMNSGIMTGTYTGEVRNNQPHGQGSFEWNPGTDRRSYEGAWSENRRHGQGRMEYSNNDVYEGGWSGGLFTGTGTMTYAGAGISVTGTWASGRIEGGQGVINNAQGSKVYEGAVNARREDVVRHGQGQGWYEDGTYYIGEWQNDKRHGRGILYDAAGNEQLNGNWVNGDFAGL